MKKITLLIVLCFAFTNAQTILYTTDLSSPGINDWGDWRLYDIDRDGETFFPAYLDQEQQIIGYVSLSKIEGVPTSPDNYLRSPDFNIPAGATGILLTLEVYSFGDDLENNFEESFFPIIYFTDEEGSLQAASLSEGIQTFTRRGFLSLNYTIPNDFEGTDNFSVGLRHFGSSGKEGMALLNAQISYGNELSNNENELTEMISVYPVPASEYITINTSLNIDRAKIVNQLGQVVLTTNDLNLKKIDISTLKSGVYSLLIKSGNKSKTLRFVKN
jgi:hypothetical protein